jgi:hypothetical protein
MLLPPAKELENSMLTFPPLARIVSLTSTNFLGPNLSEIAKDYLAASGITALSQLSGRAIALVPCAYFAHDPSRASRA